jgi:hypothetical protein
MSAKATAISAAQAACAARLHTQIAALEAMAFAPLERSLRYEVARELAPP